MAKAAEAFRTISEAAKELAVPQHVLRHWEDVFGQIRPMRRAGGRRYYRPIDIDLLRGVRILLYEERYTTKGVQKIFKQQGAKFITDLGRKAAAGEPIKLDPIAEEPGALLDSAANIEQSVTPTNHIADPPLPDSKEVLALIHQHRERLTSLLIHLEEMQNKLDDAVLAIETISLTRDQNTDH